MPTKEPPSLLKAIVQISYFSYQPSIKKFPFLKKYLEKEKISKEDWTLYMTAAGVGYTLSLEEDYPGEHDELIKSLESLEDNGVVSKLVKEFTDFVHNTYNNNRKLYPLCIGSWVLIKLINRKPTTDELQVFAQTVNELFNQTISEYAKEKLKHN